MTELHRIAWRSWKYSTYNAYHGPWSATHLSRESWDSTAEPTTLCGIKVGRNFDLVKRGNQGKGTCKRCLAAQRALDRVPDSCQCMPEMDERGVERVVTHSSSCPEYLPY